MSETATAPATTKAAKPAPVAATVGTRREQSLRASQTKKFPPSALATLGYGDFDRLAVKVSGEWSLADCLNPVTWGNVAGRLAEDALKTRKDWVGSVIELHHPKFYAEVVIRAVIRDEMKNPAGLDIVCVGPAQDKGGRGAARDLATGLAWLDLEDKVE